VKEAHLKESKSKKHWEEKASKHEYDEETEKLIRHFCSLHGEGVKRLLHIRAYDEMRAQTNDKENDKPSGKRAKKSSSACMQTFVPLSCLC
jgi:hypothetical protein